MPYHLLIFVITVVGWGLCLGKTAPIAVPLVLSTICKFENLILPHQSSYMLTMRSGLDRNGNFEHHNDIDD
jgi:hypothetical protein